MPGREGATNVVMSELAGATSVAVIGATGETDSLFARPLRYLQTMGFSGRIYPINPKYDNIGNLRCYPSIETLPETVDVALVLVGARRVVEIMDAVGRSGTRLAVVCASGFSETGAEGQQLQEELKEVAATHGISFVGPNSQGVYVGASEIALTFNPAIGRAKDLPKSGIVYAGQSGAVGAQVAGLLKRSQLSLSAMMSTGNEAQVSAFDLALESLALEDTRSVVVYAESVPRPERFAELLARSEEAGKPVVLLLGGFSQIARSSARSHTGSLTPPGGQVRALADYHGAPVVQEPADAVAAALVLQRQGLPRRSATSSPVRRARVGMLTTSGGSAVLAADLCAAHGVDLPPLAGETVKKLSRLIPSFGSATNPVDVTAEMQKSGADAWLEANRAVADDPNIDILWVAIGYTVGAVGVARSEAIVKLARLIDKPIIVSWLTPPEDTTEGRGILAAAGIPCLDSLTSTVRTAAMLARTRARHASRLDSPSTPRSSWDELASARTDDDVRRLLPLRFADRIASGDSAAVQAWLADRPDATFVVKGDVPGVTHKSDWGGVVVGVGPGDVPGEIDKMVQASQARFGAAAAISVEENVAYAAELLVGFQRGQAGMPPLLVLGWGGYFAEAISDTVVMPCVGDPDLIEERLGSLRFSKVLNGFRGGPVIDTPLIAQRLADLAASFNSLPDEVSELEINPVALGRDGETLTGLDLLVLRDRATRDPSR